jgi:DNA-binding transcriptional MerR regulator
MNSFTISQMQRFSGINVHSIRAWEKRYKGLKPERSEGNTRYYNGNQLRRLLNIASLMNSDYKISTLCSMSDAELNKLLFKNMEKEALSGDNDFLVSQLVAAALEFNESLFNRIYSLAIVQHGTEGTYLKVIYPFLQRLGIMWSAEKIAPAQEHFISNLIRQKLFSAIDLLQLNEQSKKHWILFLPENEFHEIGLLMAAYLIRKAGHNCTYLGANVPFDSLKEAVKIIRPSSLLLFLISGDDESHDKKLIRTMIKSFPNQKIFIAASENRAVKLNAFANIILLKSPQDLKEVIK